MISDQINYFTEANNLDENLQSAFKKGHSTETALVRVQNDILCAIDNQEVVLMALLDLSAAFDTCNHAILLSRLKSDFGISGSALAWFRSYLENRTQRVKIRDSLSDPVTLETGFPQGSGWGPQAYSKYVGPLGNLLRLLEVLFHLFADDTQLWKTLDPNNLDTQITAIEKMETSICDISAWMTTNKLKLNETKTEFIMFGTPMQMKKMQYNSICVGGEGIRAKPYVRNLGVYFDSELKMTVHVSHVVKVGYFHLRQIRVIRKYLTVHATKTLIHAAVILRIDYSNALLYGISENQLDRLQKLQNCAARIVTTDSRSVSSIYILKRLHWLPIRAWIKFKILLLSFKSINGTAPIYLRELLTIQTSCRSTRLSDDGPRLFIPKSKLKFGGDRAFSNCAPRLWNALPKALRVVTTLVVFKKDLKTFLFKEYFD